MARHKKKKSPPTPDPDDSKKKDVAEKDNPERGKDNPEPGKDNPESKKQDIPPTEPVPNEYQESRTKYMIDKLFWLRVGLAVMGGIAATFIFDSIEGEERRWASIVFMIVIFIVSLGIAKGMHMQLPKSKRKKIVTTGLGSYVFIYLFVWILSYTFVNVTGNESGIPSPFP